MLQMTGFLVFPDQAKHTPNSGPPSHPNWNASSPLQSSLLNVLKFPTTTIPKTAHPHFVRSSYPPRSYYYRMFCHVCLLT